MKGQKFRKLKVWEKAIDFTEEIYKITNSFPKEELYGLTSQIRRASISIPLNISEGSGCDSQKEFIRFLDIALRSTYEIMTGLEIAKRLKYLEEEKYKGIINSIDGIAAMIVGFKKS